MDATRIKEALRSTGRLYVNEHIELSSGEHTNISLEGNPFEGMNPDDRDGVLYHTSRTLCDLVANSNIEDVISISRDDALAKAVANKIKANHHCLEEIGYKDEARVQYIIISSIMSSHAIRIINKFILENKTCKCVLVGCLASEYDVDLDSCNSESVYSIIHLPKTVFFQRNDCPLCKMGKTLIKKKELKSERTKPAAERSSDNDRGGGGSSGAADTRGEQARSGEIQPPPPGSERDINRGQHEGDVGRNSIQGNGESPNRRSGLDNVDGDLTFTEERIDGEASEQSRGILRGGGVDKAAAGPKDAGVESASGLSFTEDPDSSEGDLTS